MNSDEFVMGYLKVSQNAEPHSNPNPRNVRVETSYQMGSQVAEMEFWHPPSPL